MFQVQQVTTEKSKDGRVKERGGMLFHFIMLTLVDIGTGTC